MDEPEVEEKSCSVCKVAKPASEFSGPSAAGYVDSQCRACRNARRKENRLTDHNGFRTRDKLARDARTSEKQAAQALYIWTYTLKSKYQMTPAGYDFIWLTQGGLCKLCGEPETKLHPVTGKLQRLAPDHDHRCCPQLPSCGKCVRGLLCGACNAMIGRVERRGLEQAVLDYLK